jgi:hypothetical protein
MGLLAKIAMIMVYISIVSGFLITAITGSPRRVKHFLAVMNGIAALIAIALLIVIRAFVYLLFQYITVMLALSFLTIFGATLGYGFYLLIHHKPPGNKLDRNNLDDYLPSPDFAIQEGIDEDRAIGRIKSGYYDGGKIDGIWYIRKTELHTSEN